jgi:DNA (cytosine-5)-methyltransferase 1
MTAKLNLISLYTGAGGLDYGFEAAGFQTRVAIEFDEVCCQTIRKNRNWPLIDRDINAVSSSEILDLAGLRPGQVDILVGGPPCQPFSKSSYWVSGDTLRLDDPRANTLFAYMRCVSDFMPSVFLLENVHGIRYSGKEEGFRFLYAATEEINRKCGKSYKLTWNVLNTADYGIPQMRERFFLVGQREGKPFQWPLPTNIPAEGQTTPESLFGKSLPGYVTAWEAIGQYENELGEEDLQLRGYWRDLLPSIPEGENYLWHTNRKGGIPLFGWRTRYWSFLLKLAKNRPSWTIQAQPGPGIGPFHWKNRRLSVREMAAIQTFPKNVVFSGNRGAIQRQLGNAVPSLMAEILAREISQQFFGRKYKGSLVLAVPRQDVVPAPDPVLGVPEKYLIHQGDHPDHPGEGIGSRANKGSRRSRSRNQQKGLLEALG